MMIFQYTIFYIFKKLAIIHSIEQNFSFQNLYIFYCDIIFFNKVMSNQSQNSFFLLNPRITQEQKIIRTLLKNDFVEKTSSFHDSKKFS